MSEAEAAASGPPTDAPPAGFHRRPPLGYALYLSGALLFGINGTVSKVLLTAVDDAARISQLRVTFAFLILLAFVAVTNRRSLPLHRHELGPVAAYGILGVAMTQWLYFVAITRMPIGIALLIEFTAPIMVVLWVRYAWHRPVRNTVWLGLALAMAGLAMVAQIWIGLTLNSLGVAAAFGAAVALAVYYLLGETNGQQRDPVSLTLWGFGFAALLWAVVLPGGGSRGRPWRVRDPPRRGHDCRPALGAGPLDGRAGHHRPVLAGAGRDPPHRCRRGQHHRDDRAVHRLPGGVGRPGRDPHAHPDARRRSDPRRSGHRRTRHLTPAPPRVTRPPLSSLTL